jgi:hypothetical protein
MHKVFFRDEDHKYFLDEGMTKEVPGVSSILEHFGYSDFKSIKKFIGEDALKRAQDYGTAVHRTCEFYDKGTLGKYDPKIEGCLEAWKQYRRDNKIKEFFIIEEPLVSKVWGFAGTPDRMQEYILDDIKTGSHQVSHFIQSALYKILIDENFPSYKVRHRRTVQLSNKGYKIIPHKDKQDIVIAKAMLVILKDKRKKGLKK